MHEPPPVSPPDDPSASQRQPDGRREPRWGNIRLGEAFAHRSAATRPRAGGRPWREVLRAHRLPITGAAVAALLLALVAFRQPLGDRIWPETRAQALSEQAAAALARGRLTAADGSGARELYEAALAIDPDYGDARVGLMLVAQVALTQARSATAAGRYPQAHQALQLARALSVPKAQADLVEARLREREAGHAGIDRLLAQAAAARAARRLDGADDAALPLYQRVLALQPNRLEALEGREDALSDLLQQARLAMQRGDLAQTARLVSAARGFDPGHAELPGVQADLAQAVDRARRRADGALRAGRLERAADDYRQLLQVDPDDAAAQRGLEQVAEGWARRAGRLASDFRFADAQQALAQARAIAPESASLRDVERAIARAQQAKVRLDSPVAGRGRAQRIAVLLREAEAAEARGDLLTPPVDSAFDKLRAARALAPDDAAVRRAGARLLPMARECFERELRNNNLGRARACLDARIVLEGAGAATTQGRRRLAQRWLAVAAERLGAGELHAAASAFDNARSVDPATPGLSEFAERLRRATTSGH